MKLRTLEETIISTATEVVTFLVFLLAAVLFLWLSDIPLVISRIVRLSYPIFPWYYAAYPIYPLMNVGGISIILAVLLSYIFRLKPQVRFIIRIAGPLLLLVIAFLNLYLM